MFPVNGHLCIGSSFRKRKRAKSLYRITCVQAFLNLFFLIYAAFGGILSVTTFLARVHVENLKIDALSIRELKKYISDFNESVFVYLQSNHINTVGEFRHLTESKVRNMPAKGKQMVYKNTIIQAVKQMDTIIAKIKL